MTHAQATSTLGHPTNAVIVFVGGPGAGKSTECERLAARGVKVHSLDAGRAVHGQHAGDQKATPAALADMISLVTADVIAGETVAIDATNTKAEYRGVWVRIAQRHNAVPAARVLRTDRATCEARNDPRPEELRVPPQPFNAMHDEVDAVDAAMLRREGFEVVDDDHELNPLGHDPNHLRPLPALLQRLADAATAARHNGPGTNTAPPIHPDHHYRRVIRHLTDHAIHAVLFLLHGPTAVVEHDVRRPGTIGPARPADPLHGAAAAHSVTICAHQARKVEAIRARSAGVPWHELAAALQIDLANRREAGIAAFRLVTTPSVPGAQPTDFRWRCHSCDCIIHDDGPADGNPTNNQHGHATDCRRLAAEQAQYDALITATVLARKASQR